jgi:hypothetical protein
VQQHPGRRLVDVLGHRDDLRSGCANARDDRYVVGTIACQPVDLVHEYVADGRVAFHPLEHGLQRRPICRLRRLAAIDVLVSRTDRYADRLGLASASAALSGDRESLLVVVSVGLP